LPNHSLDLMGTRGLFGSDCKLGWAVSRSSVLSSDRWSLLSKPPGTSDRGVALSDGAIARIRNRDEMHAYKRLPKVRLRVQLVKRRKRFILQKLCRLAFLLGRIIYIRVQDRTP